MSFKNLNEKEQDLLQLNEKLNQNKLKLQNDYKEINSKIKSLVNEKEEDYEEEFEDYGDNEFENEVNKEEEKSDREGENNEIDEDFDLEQIINKNIQNQLKRLTEDEGKKKDSVDHNRNEAEKKSLREKRDELLMINDEHDKIIRLQKVKIEGLKIEIETAASVLQTKENQFSELDNKGKNITEQTKKYQLQLTNLSAKHDSIKESIKELNRLFKENEKEVSNAKNALDYVQKEHKKSANELNKKNLRINRLQEEADKIKLQVKTEKTSKNEKTNDFKKSNEIISQENKVLEKQRNELLQAIKKQLKLIDILKRQRSHLEAAQLFHFTQNEFLKTLEMGKKI